MTNPADEKRDYRALFDGRVGGRRVAKGDIVRLTEAEARYEAVVPVAAADPAALEPKGAKAKA